MEYTFSFLIQQVGFKEFVLMFHIQQFKSLCRQLFVVAVSRIEKLGEQPKYWYTEE